MTTTVRPPLLSPAEAAEYLHIAAQTLAKWRCQRTYPLPFVRVGRAIRYRLADLDAFLAAREVGTPADAE